jgi:hypothetical protein
MAKTMTEPGVVPADVPLRLVKVASVWLGRPPASLAELVATLDEIAGWVTDPHLVAVMPPSAEDAAWHLLTLAGKAPSKPAVAGLLSGTVGGLHQMAHQARIRNPGDRHAILRYRDAVEAAMRP